MARKCSVERAERTAGGFARAKKNIVIQYQGRERTEQNLLDLVKKDAVNRGVKDEDIMEVDMYITKGQMRRRCKKDGNYICSSKSKRWNWEDNNSNNIGWNFGKEKKDVIDRCRSTGK